MDPVLKIVLAIGVINIVVTLFMGYCGYRMEVNKFLANVKKKVVRIKINKADLPKRRTGVQHTSVHRNKILKYTRTVKHKGKSSES